MTETTETTDNELISKPTISAPMMEALSRAERSLLWARDLQIIDADSYQEAGRGVAQCKTLWDRIEEFRVEKTKPLGDHVKWLNGLFKPKLELAKEAEDLASVKRATWRRAEELAQMEAERIRLAKQTLLEAKADELAARAGSRAEAEAIKTQAVMEASPPTPTTIPKESGISVRKQYSAVCDDILLLCKAVCEDRSLASYVIANNSALSSLARAQKDGFKLPGCRLLVKDIEVRGRQATL